MALRSRPVGVLGGTFDPIHYGHLRPALETLENLGLAEIRFIPSRHPPHRQPPMASPEQRLALLSTAIAGQPGFVVDDRELRRAGPSYMADTLISLRGELGEGRSLCLLLGSDAFIGLPQWYRWQELAELAHLVVLHRPGADLSRQQTTFGWRRLAGPANLAQRPSGGILFQPVTQLDISATRIRTLLAAGKSPRYLLPDAVLSCICDWNLYRSASSNWV